MGEPEKHHGKKKVMQEMKKAENDDEESGYAPTSEVKPLMAQTSDQCNEVIVQFSSFA
jgi:hypothetical protein